MSATVLRPRPIVLVHGAWHGAWCWAALQAELDARGLPSYAIDLPGHGASTAPLGDLYGDAAAVADLLAAIDDEVVLVGHSYGGAVIGEAAGKSDNVAHLVYAAAFCLDKGEAVLPKAQSLPPATIALSAALKSGRVEGQFEIDPAAATAAFYGNCPPGVAAAAIARLCPQPAATLLQEASAAPWLTIDSTYVLCEQDEAIHPSHQAIMAERCDSVVRMATDHSPFASQPVEFADILEPLTRRS